jgi:hypothetical protein
MDIAQLIIRLIAFGITFFMLLEFIVVCEVDTKTGIVIAVSTLLLASIVFIIMKRYNTKRCETCGQNVIN